MSPSVCFWISVAVVAANVGLFLVSPNDTLQGLALISAACGGVGALTYYFQPERTR